MAAPQLRPGLVFRLFVPYIAPPKPKFLVLAYVTADGRARLFTINSELTEFQKSNSELKRHQINISRDDYPTFLRHNSLLCCSELLGGWSAAELEDVLLTRKECVVGELKGSDVAKVRKVVQDSPILSERDKALILEHLK